MSDLNFCIMMSIVGCVGLCILAVYVYRALNEEDPFEDERQNIKWK